MHSQLDLVPKPYGYDLTMDPTPFQAPENYKFM